MKKILFTAFLLTSACCLNRPSVVSEIYLLSAEGGTQKIGSVQMTETLEGMLFEVDLEGIPMGEHGFHIHENASCLPLENKNGDLILAGKAGAHYDPQKTNRHLGPYKSGHKGDLPLLVADYKGRVQTKFYRHGLTLKELKNKSLVIHKGGDNYQDKPLPQGGGGERIACGVIN